MMEVEVEEDCTTTVTSTPSITPTTGFEIRSDSKKTEREKPSGLVNGNSIKFFKMSGKCIKVKEANSKSRFVLFCIL